MRIFYDSCLRNCALMTMMLLLRRSKSIVAVASAVAPLSLSLHSRRHVRFGGDDATSRQINSALPMSPLQYRHNRAS